MTKYDPEDLKMISALALQGLLASADAGAPNIAAYSAVAYAKALLDALDEA